MNQYIIAGLFTTVHMKLNNCYDVNLSLLTYLVTWSGFGAAKTAQWPSWDSTSLVNSLLPQMSELVEDAVAS